MHVLGRTPDALRAAVESLPIALLVISARGRLLFANAIARRFHLEADAAVAHSAAPIPPSKIAARLRRAARTWRLTPREVAVLECLVDGHMNKTIADRLACTEKTVETHATRIYRKAGVANRTHLVARFWHESNGVRVSPDREKRTRLGTSRLLLGRLVPGASAGRRSR
jgi:DNA-binding NarL/FixJ family response regulator